MSTTNLAEEMHKFQLAKCMDKVPLRALHQLISYRCNLARMEDSKEQRELIKYINEDIKKLLAL